MKLKTVLGVGAAVLIGVSAYFVWNEARSRWVDAGYVGILYDARGGVRPGVIKPSRVYVGFRQRLYTYPTKLQSAKYLNAADEGEVKAADGILITTSENANTTFDVTVIYRVLPDDALKVFNSFGPMEVSTIQSTHIRRAVKDVVNEVGPQYDVFDLMGPKRAEFSQKATEALKKRMAPNGLTIDGVLLMSAYPTPETQEKINRRINQYTEYEIALIRQKIAEVQSQRNVIEAQARRVATRLVAAGAKDKGLDQLRLQADEEAIERWNGRLPALRTGSGQTMVIDSGVLSALGTQSSPRAARTTPAASGDSETTDQNGN